MAKSINILDNDYKKWVKEFEGDNEDALFHQLGGIFEIPWIHHCLIMDKVKDSVVRNSCVN